MRSAIELSGKTVQLCNSIYAQLVYKQQFHRDLIPSYVKLTALARDMQALNGKETDDAASEDEAYKILEMFTELQTGYFEILWAYAVAADKTMPPLEDWLYEYGDAEFKDVSAAVNSLTSAMIKTDRKNV